MTDIVFKLDPEIIIGNGTINRAGSICKNHGLSRNSGAEGQALVICEKALYENRSVERLNAVLADAGVEAIVFDEAVPTATAELADAAAELARGARCTAIIGFGSPVTQSIARIAAITAHSKLKAAELLDGQPPAGPALPYIAIATTARDPFILANSFIAVDPRDRTVKLLNSPPGLCIAAIFDSGVAESYEGKFAASAFFDGFCIAVESYCSAQSQFASDMPLEKVLRLYVRMMDLLAAKQLEGLPEASAQAAFLTALGAALSAPGIGTALGYALSGRFPIAKTWCSSALLPVILQRLVTARPERMAKVAALAGESTGGLSAADAAALAVSGIQRRIEALQAPTRLKAFNLSLDRLVPVAESARNLPFVAHCPWTVTVEEAYGFLKQAF
jgi:alcohol dehydrogenase